MDNANIDTNPVISVGVASYNNSRYVIETLESIVSQSYKNIELVIVDDCSSDDSVVKINKFLDTVKVTCKFHVNKQNKGVVYVCNKLLSMITGQYYTLIGSDDLMLPDRIEMQFRMMVQQKADMTFGNINIIDENGNLVNHHTLKNELPTGEGEIKLTYKELIHYNFITAPTVMLKTSCIKNINGYSTKYAIEDLPLWVMMAKKNCKIVYINQVFASYRILSTSLNNKITTRLWHFCIVRDNVKDFTLKEKVTVYANLLFGLINQPEFRKAYLNWKKENSRLIYWFSVVNSNSFLHFFVYKLLRVVAMSKNIKSNYNQILLREI